MHFLRRFLSISLHSLNEKCEFTFLTILLPSSLTKIDTWISCRVCSARLYRVQTNPITYTKSSLFCQTKHLGKNGKQHEAVPLKYKKIKLKETLKKGKKGKKGEIGTEHSLTKNCKGILGAERKKPNLQMSR